MLSLRCVSVQYEARTVLDKITLDVASGQLVMLQGRHGSGRSTLLKAVAGQVDLAGGQIFLGQHNLTGLPVYQRARLGLSWLAEDRGLFTDMSVYHNLWLGCGPQMPKAQKHEAVQAMYERYPLIARRANVLAGTLSGGEQQLLAFVRCVISCAVKPAKLLLLDEPTEGLALEVIEQVFLHLSELKQQQVAMIVVEQNGERSGLSALADHVFEL